MNQTLRGIAQHIGGDSLRALQTVRIGIAGCGGLGSNCANHLVRSGFSRFVLCDFDRVEASNLNRQFFFADQIGQMKANALADNLRHINPDVDVSIVNGRLTAENCREIFAQCAAVVECLDDATAKARLTEGILPTGTFYVAASGIAGYGNADAIRTRKVRDGFYLVGDMQTEASASTPPFSPGVGIAAAKQADVVLTHFLTTLETS